MTDYFQPAFYKLNEDSTALIKFVASKVEKVKSILDLGAGSGVIGIELSNILVPEILCFVEVQAEWESYLKKNVETFLNKQVQYQIYIETFGNWLPKKEYDLIVCNPPYFLPGHGKPNSNRCREISRSFIVDGWDVLLNKISISLSSQGRAFIVVRKDQRILNEVDRKVSKIFSKKYFYKHLVFIELARLNIN